MKRYSKILTLAIVLLFAGTLSFTQDSGSEKVTVPFSSPGKPGKIEVSNQRGSITVIGYSGQEVIVEAKVREKKLREAEEAFREARVEIAESAARKARRALEEREEEADREQEQKTAGLKRLALPGSLGFTVEEEGNTMQIRTSSMRQAVDLEIQVPYSTSLEMSSMMGGTISVENVTGKIDVNNMNGPIRLISISGAAVAHSLNGGIEAVFKEVYPDKPMSFSTMNGDIDLTLPSGTKANLKMKTDFGDIFSDFEIKIDTTPQKVTEEPRMEGGRYRISFEKYHLGRINGGGPEYLVKTVHGDIMIRKAK